MGLFDWWRRRTEAHVERHERTEREEREEDAALQAARETTRRPFVRISADPPGEPLSPIVSKYGGVPYVPLGSTPPPAKLLCVAQINLAEVPEIADLPLPRSGLLQFWIEDDDVLGLYDAAGRERTDGHRCIYHADLDAPQTPNIPPAGMRGPLAFDAPEGRRMRFEARTELVPYCDHAWDGFLAANGLPRETELDEPHGEDTGDKLGGYCVFTQGDPRSLDEPMLSLLQLDSTDATFWGDTGIAHWFIRDVDLRAANFAAVRYYWDCC
jgi:uncharacterized protein YwqG